VQERHQNALLRMTDVGILFLFLFFSSFGFSLTLQRHADF
jgi:hypothetical protein